MFERLKKKLAAGRSEQDHPAYPMNAHPAAKAGDRPAG
jgi:hypothetical protein